jgi:hypothetical protein
VDPEVAAYRRCRRPYHGGGVEAIETSATADPAARHHSSRGDHALHGRFELGRAARSLCVCVAAAPLSHHCPCGTAVASLSLWHRCRIIVPVAPLSHHCPCGTAAMTVAHGRCRAFCDVVNCEKRQCCVTRCHQHDHVCCSAAAAADRPRLSQRGTARMSASSRVEPTTPLQRKGSLGPVRARSARIIAHRECCTCAPRVPHECYTCSARAAWLAVTCSARGRVSVAGEETAREEHARAGAGWAVRTDCIMSCTVIVRASTSSLWRRAYVFAAVFLSFFSPCFSEPSFLLRRPPWQDEDDASDRSPSDGPAGESGDDSGSGRCRVVLPVSCVCVCVCVCWR